MENPFKFGTIVEEEFFTDRVNEVDYITQFVQSANHLILISPRRFGKSSVVAKALKQSKRKHITVNLQQVTSVSDLSAKLLREFFKVHPLERVRHLITHFRVIPTISTNPITGSMDVSFQPGVEGTVLLEDVLTLIEKAHSEKDRLIVVLDEFQEILDLAPNLDRQMRSIMQLTTSAMISGACLSCATVQLRIAMKSSSESETTTPFAAKPEGLPLISGSILTG